MLMVTPDPAASYPLAEKHPEGVRTATGKSLADVTLDAVIAGEITSEDLAITPQTLLLQAEIARAAGRAALATNFERAAEMARLPQEVIFAVYELLRPGRAKSKTELLDAANDLRQRFGAEVLAGFLEEAADVYERRGLYGFRY